MSVRTVDKGDEELGRRVAAAILSYTQGVSLQTAYSRLQGREIGGWWIEEGKRLQRIMMDLACPDLPEKLT
jgi:hypothetical protein